MLVFSVGMDSHLIFDFEALRTNQSPLPWRISKTRLAPPQFYVHTRLLGNCILKLQLHKLTQQSMDNRLTMGQVFCMVCIGISLIDQDCWRKRWLTKIVQWINLPLISLIVSHCLDMGGISPWVHHADRTTCTPAPSVLLPWDNLGNWNIEGWAQDTGQSCS